MSTSLLSIAKSGLDAASLGLSTTNHNISNVNTAGYSRQQIVQAAATANSNGAGYVGSGVQVTSIKRVAEDYLTQQVQLATADDAASTAAVGYLNQISDNLTSDTSSLSSSLDSFFSALQTMSATPSDATARQSAISSAQALVNRFNTLDGQMTSMSTEIGQRLQSSATQINSYAQQISKLNDQIALQQNSGNTPNDLLDQRDQLITSLSALTRVSTVAQSDGRVNVFLASGDALVLGNQSNKMVVLADAMDPTQFAVAVQGESTGGVARSIRTSVDLGGTVGGLMKSQTVIADTRNQLGRIAVAFADAVNQQQAQGVDLNGAQGGNLFSIAAPKSFAMPGATGAISVSYADTKALTGSDYKLDYDGTQYTLTRQSDGTATTYSSLPQTVDGITINATSAPAAGDSFIIQPTREAASALSMATTNGDKIAAGTTNASGDNTNINAMAALVSANLVNGKTLGDANGTMMGQIGNTASAMQIEAKANTSLLQQATTQQQSVSGVNLDEEAANLLKYQQAYQAAAKAMAIADQVFKSILDIMG